MHPFTNTVLVLAITGLATALPVPVHSEPFNAGQGPAGTAGGPHGIGHPADYAFDFNAKDAVPDPDFENFTNQVYYDGGRQPPQYNPNPIHIPTHIRQSPAAREFDEDLGLREPKAPKIVPVLGQDSSSPSSATPPKPQDSNNVSGGQEIPASEIAAEFPEYHAPKTFSTERVDYSLRTTAPSGSGAATTNPGETISGEDNANVSVFSDDKAFHWSGGNGDVLPKNDPNFKHTMSWITGKFKGDKSKELDGGVKKVAKPRMKSRVSVFDALRDY